LRLAALREAAGLLVVRKSSCVFIRVQIFPDRAACTKKTGADPSHVCPQLSTGVKASAAKGKKPSTPVEILRQENELLKETIAATDATGRFQPLLIFMLIQYILLRS